MVTFPKTGAFCFVLFSRQVFVFVFFPPKIALAALELALKTGLASN